MKTISIENWEQHGDYMLYASMVDETKKWIMLEATSNLIRVTGKEDAIADFCKLLEKKNIKWK